MCSMRLAAPKACQPEMHSLPRIVAAASRHRALGRGWAPVSAAALQHPGQSATGAVPPGYPTPPFFGVTPAPQGFSTIGAPYQTPPPPAAGLPLAAAAAPTPTGQTLSPPPPSAAAGGGPPPPTAAAGPPASGYPTAPEEQPPPPPTPAAVAAPWRDPTHAAATLPPLPVGAFDGRASNLVLVSGVVAVPPQLVVAKQGATKVELILLPFTHQMDQRRQDPIKVEVWGELAMAAYYQVRADDTLSIAGRLSLDLRVANRRVGGPPLRLEASNLSRVDPATIPPDVFVNKYEGVYEGGRATAGTGTGRRAREPRSRSSGPGSQAATDLATWTAGTPVNDLSQQTGRRLGDLIDNLLLARAAAPQSTFDWERLLTELSVDQPLLTAIQQGLADCAEQRDKQGAVLRRPVRDLLLQDPVVGPAVQAQEAAAGGNPDLTYAQILAVREAGAAGWQ